ncbi:MAG: site-2 protease family protein [Candidatus Diapherotrites archaeon]|nr:site-2 protease family protein [Candidatus Diapherotrites archaeon]
MATKQSFFYFSPQEKKDLLISWITLSLAFAVVISPVFLNISNIIISLPIALLAVGTGFVLHELAHREAAKHYGFHSEFRAWYMGLAIAVIIAVVSMGQFIFAAPGATYFFATSVTKKQNGIISAAGPVVNIILGTILLLSGINLADSFLQKIFLSAAMINFYFALFNLLPIPPLDGSKVIKWNPIIWAILIGLSAIFSFFVL